MNRIAAAALVCLIAIAAAPASEEIEAGINWSTNIGRAVKEAGESGKPVLVDIWAVWCVPCKEMEKTTYRDPRVVDIADSFVALKVDADVQEAFIDRHRIDAFPTVLFLDGRGKEISRLLGLITAPQLFATMRAVNSGYANYLDAQGRLEDPEAAESAAVYLLEAGNAAGAARLARRALKKLKDAPPVRREGVELIIAEAELADDDLKPAARAFQRLSVDAKDPEVRGRALAGLVQAQRQRGRDADADRALTRLREQFPETAARLAIEDETP